MKKEDRIRMLLNMERYNEEQLEQMLEDTNIPTPDTEKEWQRFQARTKAPKQMKQRRTPMQWAAMLIAIAAISGISYAAIHHFVLSETAKENTTVASPSLATDSTRQAAPVAEATDSVRQTRNFNNVQLAEIMNQISKDFGVKVIFANEKARTIRLYLSWEADDTIQEIINRINHFEKVHLTLSDETITID